MRNQRGESEHVLAHEQLNKTTQRGVTTLS